MAILISQCTLEQGIFLETNNHNNRVNLPNNHSILDMYTSKNRSSKHMKQKLIELREKTDKFIIINYLNFHPKKI